MRPWILFALIMIGACRFPDADQHFGLVTDDDDDGYASDVDCDDGDAAVNPGADEICNDIDDDCNDLVDDDPIDDELFYEDDDGDGFAATGAASERACEAPAGFTSDLGDCNDSDKDINPDATDIAGDDIDQDCNGFDTVACYLDDDQDGHGTDDLTTVLAADGSCDTAQKESAVADDCDDANADRYPGNTEVPNDGTDQDCDGIDPDPCYVDDDEDGFGDPDQLVVTTDCTGAKLSTNADDCDDSDETVEPGGAELCDGQQNDCDNWTGPGNPGALPADEVDNDGDHQVECTFDGDGWDGDIAVTGDEDCDDTDETVKVGGTELCDGQQNDCDNWAGPADPGTLPANEVDNDGDFRVECTFDAGGWDGDGSIVGGQDCDDTHATVYGGAADRCDGLVNDCADWDGPGTPGDLPDDEADLDDDGWVECEEDVGGWQGTAVSGYEDCADDDVYVHPTAPELCDLKDNDCNEIIAAEEVDMISLEESGDVWTDVTSLWVGNVVDVNTAGTYWVCPGTYATLPVVTVDGVSIVGRADDPTGTTFDGEDSYRAFETDTDGTTLISGIKLDNGAASDDTDTSPSPEGYGGAAYVRGGGNVTFDNCIIEDSASSLDGGGVYVEGGTVSFTDTLLQNNDGAFGGNVYVEAGTVSFDADTDITLGDAIRGGGVYIEDGAVTILGNVEDNTATSTEALDGDGGGLYLLDGTLTLTGALVDGNTCEIDGGGILMIDGTLVASGGTVISNNSSTDDDAGGLFVLAGSVTLSDTDFDTNHSGNASGDSGGGLYMFGGTVGLTNVDFLSNTTGDNGGAIWQGGGTLTTTGSTLTTNIAEDSGGGIYQDGGTSTHNTFTATGNEARGGSGEGGGAIDIIAGTMTLNTATLTNNKAHATADAGNDGGALLVEDDAATVVINGPSTISGNQADDQGGAIRCFSDGCNVTVTDTNIFNNTGLASGGIHLSGATASFTCIALTVGSGGVYSNTATDSTNGGGGARITDGTLTSTGCDWGTGAGSDDNSPADIRYGSSLATFGDNATFTCDETTCPQ